ncbi:MAG: carbonic anhydrase family protein [Kordiimonadaceae bacterium]|nr:carbonic anhydrase family protein [Kordiimonadaceae bacterium]
MKKQSFNQMLHIVACGVLIGRLQQRDHREMAMGKLLANANVRFLARALSAALVGAMAFTASANAQSNWSYSGSNGPNKWHEISGANSLCRAGRQQSPINIEGTDPAVMHRLKTNYLVTPVHLKNNRISVNMFYKKGSILTVGTKVYELEGFDFHTPAEHAIAGKRMPMSIQFMHRARNGSRAIIEVQVKEGRTNIAGQELWELLPLEPDQVMKRIKTLVNARDLMPFDKAYYRYMGSMTTPPCREGVNWYILKTPIEFSKEQIALIRGIVGGDTARPLQNRNNRIILDARPQ